MTDTSKDKSLPTVAAELYDLVRAYVKQETVEPMKGLGRVALFGIVGSLLLGIGLVELAVGGLRALQTETGGRFDGNWSWAPYLIVLLGTTIVIMLARRGMAKRRA
jgi:hypothetical protein